MSNTGNTLPLHSILPMDNIGLDLANEVLGTSVLPIANGGTGSGSGVAATDGQVYIGSTATGLFTAATLTGTANQVVVTNAGGSITLSTPQSINTTSSPTFAALTLTAALTVANGGTGAQSLTAYNVLTGNGTGVIQVSAPGAAGIPLVSAGVAAKPIFSTATVPGGGTGAVTLTNHGVVIGQGTSAVTVTAAGTQNTCLISNGAGADPAFGVLLPGGGGLGSGQAPTNGQIPIGSTASGYYTPATLTSTSTLTFTPGANTLAIDVTANSITTTQLSLDMLQHVQVTLSSADILGLNATAKTLVNAVASKIIVFKGMSFKILGGTNTYAAGSTVQVQWHTGPVAASNTIAAADFQAANTVAVYRERNAIDASLPAANVNDALELKATGSAFTTGNGTAVADVWYCLAPA